MSFTLSQNGVFHVACVLDPLPKPVWENHVAVKTLALLLHEQIGEIDSSNMRNLQD